MTTGFLRPRDLSLLKRAKGLVRRLLACCCCCCHACAWNEHDRELAGGPSTGCFLGLGLVPGVDGTIGLLGLTTAAPPSTRTASTRWRACWFESRALCFFRIVVQRLLPGGTGTNASIEKHSIELGKRIMGARLSSMIWTNPSNTHSVSA